MYSLAEETALRAVNDTLNREETTNLVILTRNHLIPEIRNILVTSLPEGTKYEGSGWTLPNQSSVSIRAFQELPPESKYTLCVCSGGSLFSDDEIKSLKKWRKNE